MIKEGKLGGGNKNCTKNKLGVLSLKLEMVILSEFKIKWPVIFI